jgi:regulator of sirC expression with transglutaminase-like and TPR domain
VTEDKTDIETALGRIGEAADEDIDLPEAALTLAVWLRPEEDLAPHRRHLSRLAGDVAAEAAPVGGADAPLEERIAVLDAVIRKRWGYRGDGETYNDPANADLVRVMERRKGLPMALGILYIHAARRQGWPAWGLSFPRHFLVRLDHPRGRAILDPFRTDRVLDASDLRQLLKEAWGPAAELDSSHYEAIANRDILLRLQNSLRLRLLRQRDVRRAVAVTTSMLLIAPDKPVLWRDVGVLLERLGETTPAISALQRFLHSSTSDAERHQTAALLQRLRASLT